MSPKRSVALSSAGVAIVVLILALAAVSVVYVSSTQGNADQLSSQSQQIQSIQSALSRLSSSGIVGNPGANFTLPVMNQPPTIRTVWETWFLSTSAHQDRFDPSFVVVNQGDTIRLTLLDNDTVAHDFAIGPPYNILVNATVPGLTNDLTGQNFTTPATNNSPGVVVSGTPGNVTATYSFVAKFSGIYEFVCTYHAEVGMIGYLVVLPNAAYNTKSTTSQTSGASAGSVAVTIAPGAGTNTTNKGFYPNSITVVIGVNNTVVWTNNDTSPHTVTANDGSFDSGNLAQAGNGSPGGTFTFTFTKAGTYYYHCTYHPWMTGTVIVKAAA